MRTPQQSRTSQTGQTIALVAVSMVGLLAISALAIDLTTLYVARSEIQHAADAAALAGAKAFVDSGVTTDPNNTNLQSLAQNLARAYVPAAVTQNFVSGAPATLVAPPTINFNLAGNPRLTITLRRNGLPIFFGRIFGNSLASVSASAMAEAYNPAYSQTNTASFQPSAPKCVKPLLVPNNDPSGTPVFVNPSTGAVNVAAGPFIGQILTLTSACKPGNPRSSCVLTGNPAMRSSGPNKTGDYLPMTAPTTHQYCPSSSATGCSGGGITDYEQSIRCCDGTAFDFQQCGSSSTQATWDPSINPGGPNRPTQDGVQCVAHIAQQDTLDPSNFLANKGPLQISPGAFSQARYGILGNALMGTSDSIVTVPLFDNQGAPGSAVTIVGFLQLFVNDVGPGRTDVNAYIVNVVGCGSSGSSSAPVSGGGASPIPVRLIHN